MLQVVDNGFVSVGGLFKKRLLGKKVVNGLQISVGCEKRVLSVGNRKLRGTKQKCVVTVTM